MDERFIYRTPMFDFDILDRDQVSKNYKVVLKAISFSSNSLFNSLNRFKSFDHLPEKLQIKVYKYLIRGKYRATPFGLWAGLGIAAWGEKSRVSKEGGICQLEFNRGITEWSIQLEIQKYMFHPGIYFELNKSIRRTNSDYIFWAWDYETSVWKDFKVKRAEKLDEMLCLLEAEGKFSYSTFNEKVEVNPNEIWAELIMSGLIVICSISEFKKQSVHQEWKRNSQSMLYLHRKLDVSNNYCGLIDLFLEESGGIFKEKKSFYMESFLSSFFRIFDDKYISLDKLFDERFGLGNINIEAYQNRHKQYIDRNEAFPLGLFSEKEEVDLRSYYKTEVFDKYDHISFCLKPIGNDRIFLENIAIDRPFSYCGRFVDFPSVRSIVENSKNELIDKYPELIFAEVIICESQRINSISNGKAIFESKIRIFGSKHHDQEFTISDLYIGFNGKALELIDKKSRRRVVPVFPHAISGLWISHPICRLLWEIAYQNLSQPLFYHEPEFFELPYSPRLCWGNVVLYPRKWCISEEEKMSFNGLKERIRNLGVPNKFILGDSDKELYLDIEKPWDMEILYEKYVNSKRVILSECLWGDQEFLEGATYPQFVSTKFNQKFRKYQPIKRRLNIVQHASTDWESYHFYMEEGFLKTFLLITGTWMKTHKRIWFYAYYLDPQLQLRVRIKNDPETSGAEFLYFISKEFPWIRFDCIPYYPENEKYGKVNPGISEEIFCWESGYFTKVDDEGVLLECPLTMKIGFSGEFWSELIKALGLENQITKIVASQLKTYSLDKKKEFVKQYQEIEKMKSGFELNIFIKDYFFKIQEIKEVNGADMLYLVLNHMHMFHNRLFLTDLEESEKSVAYFIYRRILKARYCGVMQ